MYYEMNMSLKHHCTSIVDMGVGGRSFTALVLPMLLSQKGVPFGKLCLKPLCFCIQAGKSFSMFFIFRLRRYVQILFTDDYEKLERNEKDKTNLTCNVFRVSEALLSAFHPMWERDKWMTSRGNCYLMNMNEFSAQRH